MPRKSRDYLVPALDKSLDILEALSASPIPLALSEIAEKLSRSVSEIFRMCNRLEARGYITRSSTLGKYSLSLKLYQLAHTHSPVDHLLRAARIPMRGFTETTQESCHLSILQGDELLVIAQSESPALVRLSVEIGGRFPALATVSGRLLLAQLPAEERQEALRRLGLKTPSRLAPVERQLRKLAQDSVSRADGESLRGIRDTAVLVGNPAGGIVAALACARLIGGPHSGADEQLIKRLQAASADITHRLGL